MRLNDRGFWLSEILFSLWLVAFVGASLIGLFSYLAKTTKLSSEQAEAQLLASRVLEDAASSGPPLWGLSSPADLGQVIEVPASEHATALSYSLKARQLGSERLGLLFSLEVQVWWAPDQDTTSGVERGRGTIVREKKIYIEDAAP